MNEALPAQVFSFFFFLKAFCSPKCVSLHAWAYIKFTDVLFFPALVSHHFFTHLSLFSFPHHLFIFVCFASQCIRCQPAHFHLYYVLSTDDSQKCTRAQNTHLPPPSLLPCDRRNLAWSHSSSETGGCEEKRRWEKQQLTVRLKLLQGKTKLDQLELKSL